MSARWLAFGISAGLAALAACASETDPDSASVEADASEDAGYEAAADVGRDACDGDCVYFPSGCSSDTLCPNDPFDPATTFGPLDPRTQINTIAGRSAEDVWVAGALGAVAHFDGEAWSRSDPGTRESMLALWLRGTAEIVLPELHQIYSRGLDLLDAGTTDASGGGWVAHTPVIIALEYTKLPLQTGWAAPDAEWLWCGTARRDPDGSDNGLWRLRIVPSANTFEIGQVVPYNFCLSAGCGTILGIHGISRNDLWAVGTGGAVVHVTDADGDAPAVRPLNSQTTNALRGVWAFSETEAWLVGANGTIRRYTGDPIRWEVVDDVPTTVNLNAVVGSSPSDVWAVGDEGVALHYDGARWSRVPIAGLGLRRPKLTAAWTSGPGHVWIGGQGVLLSLGGKP